MKTLYLFFEIANRVRRYDKPRLYAYTTSKKMMKRFRDTRDMKLFYMDEKEISTDNFNQFQNHYSKQRLTEIGFETIDDSLGIRNTKCVNLVGTIHEEEYVFLNCGKIDNEIIKKTHAYSKYLDDEWLSLLQEFHYFDYCKFKDTEYNDSFYAGIWDSDFDQFEDYTIYDKKLDVKYDQLSVFLYFFGYTMKLND